MSSHVGSPSAKDQGLGQGHGFNRRQGRMNELSFMPQGPRKRRKIWELNTHWHCSIVGTCLTFEEARKIGRKYHVTCADPSQLNAVIHTFIVRECKTKSPVATHVNNLLDRKFEGAIRQCQRAGSSADIVDFWIRCYATGNIPGAYWAASTNSMLSRDDANRVFSDVHMLSHLVGSSNQALITRLQDSETRIEAMEDRQAAQRKRQDAKLAELENELQHERDRRDRAEQMLESREPQTDAPDVVVSADQTEKLARLNEELREQLGILHTRLGDSIKARTSAEENAEILETRLADLEQLIDIMVSAAEGEDSLQLSGKRILYVGGRPQTHVRIRNFVEKLGGTLDCHDGGKTKTAVSALNRLVSSSDAVFLPVDNVSHTSALEANRACRNCCKPFFPIKSCSFACFAQALKNIDSAEADRDNQDAV